MHCDKHMKMILEAAQICVTALSFWGLYNRLRNPYRPTHKHHPCVLWAAGCMAHMNLLIELATHLGQEFENRYGKRHKSMDQIEDVRRVLKENKDKMPHTVDSSNWVSWVSEVAGVKISMQVKNKIATCDIPPSIQFGILAIDPWDLVVTNSNKELKLVDSYQNYYDYKRKYKMNMTWCRSRLPPPELVTQTPSNSS